MTSSGCLPCEVRDGTIQPPGGIIYNDGLWIVDHSLGKDPSAPIPLKGFLIVTTTRHVEHLHELTDEEARGLHPLLHDLTKALWSVVSPERIYICSFGELVKHVHFYVIPRYSGMPASPNEVLAGMFREWKWTCSRQAAEEVALKVKSALDDLLKSRQDADDILEQGV
ncbi:MAG: HIT family protein [Patescibacteria group bacterium]